MLLRTKNMRTRFLWRHAKAIILVTFVLFLVWPKNRFSNGRDPCEVASTEFLPQPNSRLPKLIHQQWFSDPIVKEPQKSWRDKVLKIFPDHHHLLWTDEKARHLIETKFPWFLKQYDTYDVNIKRVDAARYFILYEYGGLYMDLDYEPLENFWDRLPDDAPAVIQSMLYVHESVQNSLMSSPPKHEFWNVTFHTLMEAGRATKNVIRATGPLVVEDSLRKYSGYIGILPCENWQRKGTDVFHPLHRLDPTLSYFILPCGDISDMKCQFGIHHGTSVYASI